VRQLVGLPSEQDHPIVMGDHAPQRTVRADNRQTPTSERGHLTGGVEEVGILAARPRWWS